MQAAARAYFDKDVGQLTLAECAFLAILPKSAVQLRSGPPPRAARWSGATACSTRCCATASSPAAQHDEALAEPLGTVRGAGRDITRNVGGYFMEEVRRHLIARYGEAADEAARTASMPAACGCAPPTIRACRQAAETALRDGLMRYERGRGWRDPGLTVDLDGDWRSQLARRAARPRLSRLARGGGACRRKAAARRSASPTAAPARCPPSPPRCRGAAPAARPSTRSAPAR